VVFAEAFVGGAAVDGVDEGFFVEGGADAPDDAAVELVGAGDLVHEGADVIGGDDAADLDHVGVCVDGYFGEDGSPGLGAVGLALFAGCGVGGDFDGLASVAADDVFVAVGFGGGGFGDEVAVFGFDVVGGEVAEGGLFVFGGEVGEFLAGLGGGF